MGPVNGKPRESRNKGRPAPGPAQAVRALLPRGLTPLEDHLYVSGELPPHGGALTGEEAGVRFQPPPPSAIALRVVPGEALINR